MEQDRNPDKEREEVLDELMELLELQIKLKEGDFAFKIAHLFGLPGTRLEHVQEKLRKRKVFRRELEKEDTKTLKRDVELSKKRLRGIDRSFGKAQGNFQEKLLRFEQLARGVSDENSPKKSRND